MTGRVAVVWCRLRNWDRVAMHCVAIPFVVLMSVRASNYVNAQASTSQEAVNAVASTRMDNFDKRLDHLEKIGDAEFLALLGVFTALIVQIVQNKNRRDPHKGKS